MSRLGKKPIAVPPKVEISIKGEDITVKGPKGTLSGQFPVNRVSVTHDAAKHEIIVERFGDNSQSKAYHGLYRSLLNNMVVGVTTGYAKQLQIVGTGYRAQTKGTKLTMQIGFSHPVEFDMPEGVTVATPSQTEIVISGCDKHMVGQVAANIRAVRPPEPYKGKGIRYMGEHVRRLAGKSFGSG